MKNRWVLRAVLLLTLSVVLNVTFSAAAEAGSASDPLVTLSYLNDTYLPAVMAKVDEKITARNTALGVQSSGSGASTFTVVTLSQGETLTGGIGCEMMLRVGTATCVAASAPGLIDETTGSTLASGAALTQNHLYMATIENRGAKATAATTKLLVRGSYTIG